MSLEKIEARDRQGGGEMTPSSVDRPMNPLADALLRIKEWNARDDNPDEISGDDLDTVCNALDRTLAAVRVFADPAELMSRLQASGARISHDTACRIIEDDRFGLQAIAMEAQDADLAAHDAQPPPTEAELEAMARAICDTEWDRAFSWDKARYHELALAAYTALQSMRDK